MKKTWTTYQLAATGLMAAVMCLLGPLTVPIGPVPISLTVLTVFLAVSLLGMRLGTASYLVYLALGFVGLPVFSGFTGGVAKLAGPTGGYLIGFALMALIAGAFVDKGWNSKKYGAAWAALGMALGLLVDYALGTVWFTVVMKAGFWYALTICVFPFVLGDALKIALAVAVGGLLRDRLIRAHVLKPEQLYGKTGQPQ